MAEPIVLREPGDLDRAALLAIAWEERRVELDPALLARIEAGREEMLRALAGAGAVYGINTGMGYLAGVRLTEEEQRAHQRNLLRGRAVGGPPWLDRAEARALLAVRLAGFLGGQTGVSAALCTYISDRLNDGFVPAIPRTGVGSAGEIMPLAHAFGTCIGEGLVLTPDGGTEPASDALVRRGVPPYEPETKEGIALLAGAPGAAALAIARWRAGEVLRRQLTLVMAAAIDALQAPLAPYDPVHAGLAGDPLLVESLAALGRALAGSSAPRHGKQAPVSFRVVPQVLAHLARAGKRLRESAERALGAVTDSPVFVNGELLSNGAFHAVDLAADLEALRAAQIRVAELAGQQLHRLLDARFSGLPDQLSPAPGPQAGLVVVQKRVTGILNELRRLAVPPSIGLADTSLGQEDAQTFAWEAAEAGRRAEMLIREVIACLWLACRQAWWLRGEEPAAGLRDAAGMVASLIAPVEQDRPLGEDIGRVLEAVHRESLAAPMSDAAWDD